MSGGRRDIPGSRGGGFSEGGVVAGAVSRTMLSETMFEKLPAASMKRAYTVFTPLPSESRNERDIAPVPPVNFTGETPEKLASSDTCTQSPSVTESVSVTSRAEVFSAPPCTTTEGLFGGVVSWTGGDVTQ